MKQSNFKSPFEEMNYFWFSEEQRQISEKLNPPSTPNTVVIDGKRIAYTECTSKKKPFGNWGDYIYVGKEFGLLGLIVDDPDWNLYAPIS